MPAMPRPSSKSDQQTSPVHLSKEDVERLLVEDAPDARIDIARKIAQGHAERCYSLRELTVAEQIFRVLVRDTEIVVREALADMLKDNPAVSRDIILSLTHDADTVALPLLEFSAVLTDEDLLELIHSAKSPARSVAIAARKDLPERISVALIGTRHVAAISKLLQNISARIPENALAGLVRDYGKNTTLMDALASRPGLPATLVEKIITLVSQAYAQRLREQYHLAPATATNETDKTREIATLKLVDGDISSRDIEKLVDQLQMFGRLTPSIILTSLCRGNLYFFETALARLSNIPVRNAQLLIHDKGGLGFKALYAKAALPDKFLVPAKMLLEVVADIQRSKTAAAGTAYSDMLVQKLLAKASGQNVENLSYIIALIRQSA